MASAEKISKDDLEKVSGGAESSSNYKIEERECQYCHKKFSFYATETRPQNMSEKEWNWHLNTCEDCTRMYEAFYEHGYPGH